MLFFPLPIRSLHEEESLMMLFGVPLMFQLLKLRVVSHVRFKRGFQCIKRIDFQ
jgi:hypothetical protein